MKNVILRYLKLLRKEGIRKTLWSFYSYYYSKYKINKISLDSPVKINLQDRSIFVNPNDKGLSRELIVFGYHEPKTTMFIKKYVKKDMICIDVGANIGYYSTLFSNLVGKNGKIIAIEPSPLNFEYLKNNLKLQNQNNYTVLNFACGDKQKNVNFYLDNSTNKSRIVKNNSKSNTISVEVKLLDDLIKDLHLNQIDYIKIDVEGYEWEFLKGAKKTVEAFLPTIQIEFHRIIGTKLSDIVDFLISHNYKIIFNDIGGDEGNFFSNIDFKEYQLEEIKHWLAIPKTQNSFKIIAECIQNLSMENLH